MNSCKSNFLFWTFKNWSMITMLLISAVNQLYVHTYSLPLGPPPCSPHLGHLSTELAPPATQPSPELSVSHCASAFMSNLISGSSHLPPLPVSPSALYVCIFIPSQELGISCPSFLIPHTCVDIQCLFFSSSQKVLLNDSMYF